VKTQAVFDVTPLEVPETDGTVSTRWYAMGDNRREAFALRHRGYVDAKLIEPSPFGIYSDAYDELPTTLLAGLFRRGACIATLRLSIHTPGSTAPTLPCEKVYPEVQAVKERAQGPVVELSRLSIDPDIDVTRYRARLYAAVLRAGISACMALDARHLLVATQTKWQSVYQHLMGFKALGPPQFYPPGDVPVVLLGRDLDADLRRRLTRNMFFKIDESEIEELRALLPTLIDTRAASTAA